MTEISDKAVEAAQAAWRAKSSNYTSSAECWRAALSAALPHLGAAGVAVPGWQPMDTAPKDGRHILLHVPVDGGFIYAVEGAFVDDRLYEKGAWQSAFMDNVEPIGWAPKPGSALVPSPVPQEATAEPAGGVAAIAAERRRQIEVEGWTAEHDDTHVNGEMAVAAASYAWRAARTERQQVAVDGPYAPINWPWDRKWWKPSGRRRDLVKAGALIAAEIDRLDRAAIAPAACQEGR